ncbi:MAG: hypothetical protein WCK65_09510 [Rhodospirillaceae bacterium]
MANLQVLLNNPCELDMFVKAVVDDSNRREEVVLNEGLTSREDIQSLICRDPVPFTQHDLSPDNFSSPSSDRSITSRQLDARLQEKPMPFANHDFFPDA